MITHSWTYHFPASQGAGRAAGRCSLGRWLGSVSAGQRSWSVDGEGATRVLSQ